MHVRMHLCTFACVLDKCAHSASITIEVGLQEVCEGVQPILVQAPRLREVHPEQASSIVELAHLHEELGKAIDTSSCGLDYITQPRGTYDSTSLPPFNAPTHITHIVNMSLPPMLVWHMIEIHDNGPCTFAVFGEPILGMRIRGSGIAAPQARAQSVAHWAANPSI
jgi:hypothetical protein